MKKILQLVLVSLLSGASAFGQYCTTGGATSTFDSNIEAVSLNGITSNIAYIGCAPAVAGTEDQTVQVADLSEGTPYNLDVTFGTCGGNYGGFGEAWIDWNMDGVFDPSESLGTSTGTPGAAPWDAPVTFVVNVPLSNPYGVTRMRVAQEEGGFGSIDPCGTYTWGSMVDFTISIVNAACPNPTAFTAPTVNINDVDFTWVLGGTETEWEIDYGAPGYTAGTGTSTQILTPGAANIAGLASATSYDFYLRSVCSATDSSAWVGPISLTTNAACLSPTAFASPTINAQDVDLTWTAGAAETEWTVEYGAVGFTQGIGLGTASTVLTTPATNVAGLIPGSSYDFYLRAVCAPGDSSLWVGPLNVTTPCGVFPTPYLWDVEDQATTTNYTGDACWTTSSVSAFDWNIDGAGSTPSTGTGPTSGANSGSNYFYTEASSGVAGDDATLETPQFDLTALGSPALRFFYHMWDDNFSQMGDLSVRVFDGATETEVAFISGNQGDVWIEQLVDLSAFSGIISLRFVASRGAGFRSDVSLDDIEIFDGSTFCFEPTNFTFVGGTGTTADFSWNSGSGTDFIIEYGPTGFTPGTFTTVANISGATTANITGLTNGIVYDYYLYSDCTFDTSVVVGPLTELATCASVSGVIVNDADNTSAQVSWISTGTDFIIEYGTQGFTPGAFTDVVNVNADTTGTITGLTANGFYDFYVYNDCGADSSLFAGPFTFNTYDQPMFMEADNACPAGGFVDISATGTDLLLTDDGETDINPLPFPVLFQQVIMNNVSVGNNGGMVLGTLGAAVGYGGNFNTLADGTLFPWGDDLDEETGNVYAEVIGTAPNRIMIVQWDNSCNWAGAIGDPTVTFQIQIEEATNEIYYVYDDVVFGGTDAADDYAANASIGLSGPVSDITVSDDDPQYLTDNSCAHFYYTDCPKIDGLTSLVYLTDTIIVSWNAGVAGETNWTVEYGLAGFVPGTGTTFTTTNTQDTIGGLTQLTDYDVYVYADCDVATQSNGTMLEVQTAPVCPTPTGLAATALQDTIVANWSWVGTTVASTGFNIQYGLGGAGQYNGNALVAADNNLNDTVLDNTLLGGTLYDVYVQAVCGADTSLYAGPFTVITPLTNDTTCSAIALNVDGTVYNFNNTGATVGAGETAIAPPTDGFNSANGWGNSTLNNTTWFTFDAPASGNVYITGQDAGFSGQMAVYSVTDCGDYNTFTFEGGNDNALVGGGAAPGWVQCGLTAGNTYYLMHDGNSGTTGSYSIRLENVDLNAGSFDTPIDACSGDTVDLFTAISGQDAGGVWVDYANTFQLNGSDFATTVLATGVVYEFEYRVTRECAYDSVIATVEIYGPSQAGNDGSATYCQNEPMNLFSALTGTVDVGGTWYDPSDVALPNASPNAASFAGSYNYDYIVGNGVCPDDTALVVITVDPACDYLGLEDAQLEGINIFPNPATEILTIVSNGSHEALNVEVVDVNGRVVYTSNESVLVGSTLNIDVTSFETGVYILKLYNNEVENTYRVVVK